MNPLQRFIVISAFFLIVVSVESILFTPNNDWKTNIYVFNQEALISQGILWGTSGLFVYIACKPMIKNRFK